VYQISFWTIIFFILCSCQKALKALLKEKVKKQSAGKSFDLEEQLKGVCLFLNALDGCCVQKNTHIGLPRKEVIQPQVPLRLPCYDLTPITAWALADCPLTVSSSASGTSHFRGLTGGVYKARERIHRGLLIRDY
jgi:hypothetical protein